MNDGNRNGGAFVAVRSVALTLTLGSVTCAASTGNQSGGWGGPSETTSGSQITQTVCPPAGTSEAGDAGQASCGSPATAYNRACAVDADCVAEPTMSLTAACTNCKGVAINKAEQGRYEAALDALARPPRMCPCPPAGAKCVAGTCEIRRPW